MQDRYYGDNRDLVKWGTLIELARQYQVKHILQVLYYRKNEWNQKERKHEWGPIEIHGDNVFIAEIAEEVIRHFRDVNLIRSLKLSVSIEVLNEEFVDPNTYHEYVIAEINARSNKPGIVFLDPDTGLEPPSGKHDLTHVRDRELKAIWDSLTTDDMLVFYQHETNKNGEPFIEPKIQQFAKAIGIQRERAKYAYAPMIARDVAFFFAKKECSSY